MSEVVLDLAKGSPGFLEEYWQTLDLTSTISGKEYSKLKFPLNFGMDYIFNTTEEMKHAIRKIHNAVGNANVYGKHIVVGSGVTQIIMASMYAYYKLNSSDAVIVKKPYYFRFPDFVNISKLQLVSNDSDSTLNPIELITSPNNPDNGLRGPEYSTQQKIYDFSYQWPQYLENTIYNDTNMMIFSLSKSTGHAGTRIGWGIVKDKEVADIMEYYVENTTVGTSSEAQERAKLILNIQSEIIEAGVQSSCFSYGRDELKQRWLQLAQIQSSISFDILNAKKNGMFIWCKTKDGSNGYDHMMKKFSVKSKKGRDAGMTDDYFRLCIGCKKTTFEQFCHRIQK